MDSRAEEQERSGGGGVDGAQDRAAWAKLASLLLRSEGIELAELKKDAVFGASSDCMHCK